MADPTSTGERFRTSQTFRDSFLNKDGCRGSSSPAKVVDTRLDITSWEFTVADPANHYVPKVVGFDAASPDFVGAETIGNLRRGQQCGWG